MVCACSSAGRCQNLDKDKTGPSRSDTTRKKVRQEQGRSNDVGFLMFYCQGARYKNKRLKRGKVCTVIDQGVKVEDIIAQLLQLTCVGS